MNTVKSLHRRAMDIVDEIAPYKKQVELEDYTLRLQEAYKLELQAANMLRTEFNAEPSRSVLYRSAASLAMQCGLWGEAEKLVYQALAGEPQDWIVAQLQELLEQISFSRHLALRGVELTNVEVQVVLEGPGIGFGIAPTSEVIPRVESTNLLLYRTAERLAKRDYRETGPPTNDIREQAQSFMSLPRAASYAFSLRVGKLQQMSFEDPSEQVLDNFIDCLNFVNEGNETALQEHIPDPAYYNNFVALAKSLLPDGESVKTVGFTVQKAGFTRRLALRQTSIQLKTKFSPARSSRTGRIASGKERSVEVSGQLRLADSTHETNRLKLIQENGKGITIYVPEGMMTDIVKPLWDEWVTISGLKMGRTITLLSISRMR